MPVFTTDRAFDTLTLEGVSFHVRGLTGEEKIATNAAAADAYAKHGSGVGGSVLFHHAIRAGLVRWSGPSGTPKWSEHKDDNIALLNGDTYVRVATRILELSGMREADSGNLGLQSSAPASSAAEDQPAGVPSDPLVLDGVSMTGAS